MTDHGQRGADTHDGSDLPASEADAGCTAFGKALESVVFSYLSCPRDAAKRFLGAVLVSDYRTRPIDFRFVKPVRPTAIQRLLFGRTLDEHVIIDVIGKRLLDGLPHKPDVLFVDSKQLLAIRRLVDVPVVYIWPIPSDESASSNLSAIGFAVAEGYEDDDAVAQAIAALEPTTDLLDPFSRIAEALKETMKQDK